MAKPKTRSRVRVRSPVRSKAVLNGTRRMPLRSTPFPSGPTGPIGPIVKQRSEYVSVSESFHNGVGRRNTVVIKNNGPAFKKVEMFGPRGQSRSQTRRLTPAERGHILQGRFVSGLWRNCRV
jgi:hypothetical protein